MIYRKKILLNFLLDVNYLPSIKLQKMLFLFCQKYENKFYSFLPYKYGGYSFQAENDLYTLEKKYFWVKKDNTNYALASYQDKNEIELKEEHKTEIESIKNTWQNKKEKAIIRYAYQEYPYYAIYSNLLDNNSLSDLKTLVLKHKPIKEKNKTIFTIGYEGRSVEEYFNILIKNNINLLCDVRANPSSRKYGFFKKVLKHICEQLNIIYQHTPELGIHSNLRKNLHQPSDYIQLFEQYERENLSNVQILNQIEKIVSVHKRIAFTCFEADIHSCHRKTLAEKMGTITQEPVLHL